MGKKFIEFTEEEKLKMLELHNDGLLNKDLAQIFDTSTTMVSRLLRSIGAESRHPILTEERKIRIKECYEQYHNINKVCKIMKCDSRTVSDILKEYDVEKISMSIVRRKYNIDDNYFEVIDTPNKAYALGMIFADGTISKNGNYITISLQERDKSILEALNNEYGGNRHLTFINYNSKNSNWQNQYSFSVCSKKMKDDLIKHGAIPNKSLALEFPKDVPNDLIKHFIRGYFDGDGYISKKEDRCELISTEDFCKKLSLIVKEKLNINSSIMYCHNQKDKPTRSFQIAGKHQVKNFLDWIYGDAELFMERKYDLYIQKYYPDINNSLSE